MRLQVAPGFFMGKLLILVSVCNFFEKGYMMCHNMWYSPVLFGHAWMKLIGLKEDMSGDGPLAY
jgi:hypothetical protein